MRINSSKLTAGRNLLTPLEPTTITDWQPPQFISSCSVKIGPTWGSAGIHCQCQKEKQTDARAVQGAGNAEAPVPISGLQIADRTNPQQPRGASFKVPPQRPQQQKQGAPAGRCAKGNQPTGKTSSASSSFCFLVVFSFYFTGSQSPGGWATALGKGVGLNQCQFSHTGRGANLRLTKELSW